MDQFKCPHCGVLYSRRLEDCIHATDCEVYLCGRCLQLIFVIGDTVLAEPPAGKERIMKACQICAKPIEGVDVWAAIWAGKDDAHFECFYPNGSPEPLPLPAWAIAKIAAEKPELAKNFSPRV